MSMCSKCGGKCPRRKGRTVCKKCGSSEDTRIPQRYLFKPYPACLEKEKADG